MATYHCTIKNGKKGTGKAHCDYINRENKYEKGEKAEELIYKECGNLPEWAQKPSDFFEAADIFERENGRVYSEFEIALPNELSKAEQINICQQIVQNHIGENKVYSFAIHQKKAAFDEKQNQPHAHIIFSERLQEKGRNLSSYEYFKKSGTRKTGEKYGGFKKDDRFTAKGKKSKDNILKIRESVEKIINAAYKKYDLDIRVSAKSLSAQRQAAIQKNDVLTANFFNRPAQIHLGPKITNKEKENLNGCHKNKDFYFTFMSDKARLVFLQKELKKEKKFINLYSKELQKLKLENEKFASQFLILQNEKTEIFSSKNKNEVDVLGKNLQEKILVETEKIKFKMTELNSQINAITIYSPNSIDRISISIITNKQYTNVLREQRNLKTEKAILEKKINEFSQKKNQNFYDLDNKKEYENEKKVLVDLQKNLASLVQKETIVSDKLATIKKQLEEPNMKKKFEEIRETVRKNNDTREAAVTALQKELKELKTTGKKLGTLGKSIDKRRRYSIEKKTYSAFNNQRSNIDVITNMQAAIDKANAKDSRGSMSGNMKLDEEKIRDDNER